MPTLKRVVPKNLKIAASELGNRLTLEHSGRSWGVAVFLLIWLSMWTVACGVLIIRFITEPKFENVMFAVPFLLAEVAVMIVLIGMLFGRTRLEIDETSLRYGRRALISLANREHRLDELRKIDSEQQRDSDGDLQGHRLRFETTGQTFHFGSGLTSEEADYWVERLGEHLGRLGHPLPDSEPDTSDDAENADDLPEEISLRGDPALKPSDALFSVEQDFDGLVIERLQRPWKQQMGSFFGITFVMLFWNGIVSIFVWELLTNFNWFLAVFLLPFELVGLLFLWAWCASLLAPLMGDRWKLTRYELSRHRTLSGIPFHTPRYDIGALTRLKAQRTSNMRQAQSQNSITLGPSGRYELLLLDDRGETLARIRKLTEGEARWIAGMMLQQFAAWGRRIAVE